MKKIDVRELQKNPFQMIGDEWMLISAKTEDKVNTMTASWGGMGIMWGKAVVTVYIRPQRHTKKFVDNSEYFTLSFFDGEQKKALGYLGAVSGAEVPDKIQQSGLHLNDMAGLPAYEEASLVLVCKKLYAQEMQEECFIGTEEIERWYPEKDYHTLYMAEIVAVYVAE